MIALQLSEDRLSMLERRQQIIEGLHALPSQIRTVLDGDRSLQEFATGVLANQRSLLIMGRGYQYVSKQQLMNFVEHCLLTQVCDVSGRRTQNQRNILHAL